MNKRLILSKDMTSSGGKEFRVEFWGGEVAQVELITNPTEALRTLTVVTRGYTGLYSNGDPDDAEIKKFGEDIQKTKLGTPLEFLSYAFLVSDVPRSWTHQLVRTRIGAAYVQESTRFLGRKGVYRVLAPKTAVKDGVLSTNYEDGIISSIGSYEEVMEEGIMSNEDARQLLPHALLTSVFWSITLKALMGVYEVRFCCQAESSTWLPIMKQVKSLIRSASGDAVADLLKAPIDRGQSCGFGASFDRACSWKERV